jgi:hypothetical protein
MKKLPSQSLTSIAGFISALLLATSAGGATLTVNSAADSGGSCPGPTCTLRQAIATAVSGDTISFATAITTIDLTSDELLIDKDLTISGPGADLLTVQRSDAPDTLEFHIFHVAPDVFAAISGLAIRNGSTPSLTNGGAIYNGGTLTITRCTISDNLATGGTLGGGAIYNNGGSQVRLTISNSTISGNSTLGGQGGGGIMSGGGTVIITKSTISGNSSGNTSGGGIYTLGPLTITDSTVSGNSAGSGVGGGIYTRGSLNITNSTVSGNSAGEGGGVTCDYPAFRPKNTIIATNTAALSPDVKGTANSQGYTLIGNTTGATIVSFTGDQLNVDPILGPLQDNGGPTRTHALLSGSSAIDKGRSFGSVTDQRGFARPVGIASVQGGDGSDIGAVEVQGPGTPGTLGNISTRLRVETGDNVLIGGFIITGTQPKKIIVRAIGPSLSSFFPGTLIDPILELRNSSGGLVASNDNWRSDQEAEIIATGISPSNDLESAIVATLPANNSAYTAIVRGVNNGTGIGVVEAYDLDRMVDSKLANISTRGFVQAGDDILIGGLIVVGQNPLTVMVRAIGPSLPVAGALEDPTLELRDSNGALIASSDNWPNSGQAAEISATGIAPSNDFESAILRTLTPGPYTAIVRGVNGTTGVALIEAYALN